MRERVNEKPLNEKRVNEKQLNENRLQINYCENFIQNMYSNDTVEFIELHISTEYLTSNSLEIANENEEN